MKRSLFKQLMVSAFFACSLSANVPDVCEQADDGRRTTDDRPHEMRSKFIPRYTGRQPAVGLAAHQTRACSVGLCDGRALPQPIWLSAPLAGTTPDPSAGALSIVWPLDGFGIYPMGRTFVRWKVPPNISPEAMNDPTDPLDAVFCIPRYRMSLALQESAWQVREPALSLDVSGRSGRTDMAALIPRLKEIFSQAGVPQQWVWMAEVESALNPRAKSSAGAAGLFQLMPGTARRFGLRTTPLDDRMEPEKSADAAAQYLKFLRQEFGCWSLALAAYNAGEGRVKEIMKKRKARTFAEVERYLPSETKAYVPKVMAIVALREDQFHGVPGAYWMP